MRVHHEKSRSGRFTPGTYSIGGWVGPRASLDEWDIIFCILEILFAEKWDSKVDNKETLVYIQGNS